MISPRFAQHRQKAQPDVIAPEKRFRQSAAWPSAGRGAQVSDAEFEVVSPGPRARRYPVFNDNSEPKTERPAAGPVPGGESPRTHFGTRSEPPQGRLWPKLVAAALVILACGVIFAGLRLLSENAASGLVIADIHQSPVDSNGLRIVELSGSVENHGDGPVSLPPLIAELKSETGSVSRSAVSLGDRQLAAGATARFLIRMSSPGGKRPQVSVSFAAKGV